MQTLPRRYRQGLLLAELLRSGLVWATPPIGTVTYRLAAWNRSHFDCLDLDGQILLLVYRKSSSSVGHQIEMHRIGTAGWSVPGKPKTVGTHLDRYSQVLSCVEVNSSFYRSHRAATWHKWAAATPSGFRFSIKAPKAITHSLRLRNADSLLNAFFTEISALGEKRGPVLFQLPPSLGFDPGLTEEFLIAVRKLYEAEVVLEPRHPSWFNSLANTLLQRYKFSRVAADPPKGGSEANQPGGDTSLSYYRLHGSPLIYYSNYDRLFLAAMATRLASHKNTWVIFDNTALDCAYANALQLQTIVDQHMSESR